MRKLALLSLPVLLLALGLSACGGGGESDEDRIAATIERGATSKNPVVCKQTQTLAFTEQTLGGSGKEAVKECEKETEKGVGQPDSVTVTNVEVDGKKATADAEFKGGQLNKQTLELVLIEKGGVWKLDELAGFAEFDPATFVDALAEQLEAEPQIEPKSASCIVAGMEKLSKSALESLVIENNTGPIIEIVEACE